MGFLTAVGVASLIPPNITQRIINPFRRGADRTAEHQERPDHRDENPFRWAPLFVGLCCPNSILLMFPAFTEVWYKRVVEGSDTLEAVVHPRLLVASLAASLVLGFIANVALMTRYFEYRPQISTLTAIGFLTLHDLINMTILVAFPLRTRALGDVHHFTQSFWMTVASSVVSLCCNVALIADYYLVENFRAKGSGLTNKQRSLVITCMALLIYIGIGALIFVFIVDNHVQYGDALYFCVCTVTTVGFGDITPTNAGSRVFIFFFAIFGIITLGLTINTARETIIEAFEGLWKARRNLIFERAREIRMARKAAKQRVVGIEAGLSTAIIAAALVPGSNTSAIGPQSTNLIGAKSNPSSKATDSRRLPSFSRRLDMERSTTSSTMDLSENYRTFSEKLLKEERNEYRTKLAVAVFLFLCFWLLGGVVFKFTEGWTYGQALYFGYVAFLTLGYGDLTVKSPGGRSFFLIWSLMGIATMTLLLSVLAAGWENKYKSVINKKRKFKANVFKMGKAASSSSADVEKGNISPPGGAASSPQFSSDIKYLEPEVLPQRLIEAARGFSSHAKYWMEGKKGTPPAALAELMDSVEEVDGIEAVKEKGGLAERMMSEDRQRMLFLISYARTFELLASAAEDITEFMKTKNTEVEELVPSNGLSKSLSKDYLPCPMLAGPSRDSTLIASPSTREPGDAAETQDIVECAVRPNLYGSVTFAETELDVRCKTPEKSSGVTTNNEVIQTTRKSLKINGRLEDVWLGARGKGYPPSCRPSGSVSRPESPVIQQSRRSSSSTKLQSPTANPTDIDSEGYVCLSVERESDMVRGEGSSDGPILTFSPYKLSLPLPVSDAPALEPP